MSAVPKHNRAELGFLGVLAAVVLGVAALMVWGFLDQPRRGPDSPAVQRIDEMYLLGRRDAEAGRTLTPEEMRRRGMTADDQRYYQAGRGHTSR